jgi:hypothetical protein
VPPPGVEIKDAAGVADGQGADPLVDGPVDQRFGGFVQGLPGAAAVPGFDLPGAAAGLTPPPRPALALEGARPAVARRRGHRIR